MTPFEYVSVVLSVIIGLGLSHLLTGIVGLIQERERVRFDWIHGMWVALTFVGILFLWWNIWGMRGRTEWNFFAFILLLMQPVLLFIAGAFLIPPRVTESGVDLSTYLMDSRRGIFGTYAAFALLMVLQNAWLSRGHWGAAQLLLAMLLAPMVIAMMTTNRRYHAGLAVGVFAWLCFFIVRIGGMVIS